MAIRIDFHLTPQQLVPAIERLFELSAGKILALERRWKPEHGAPVFTVRGRYTARSWTEWTQGFQFGSALLQFDAGGDEQFLDIGRRHTLERMAAHVSHVGVHDHGFNNLSTYGNLRRLMREGKIPANPAERSVYELALKVSGAVQASRWTRLADGTGFIHSFNGPHSLFIDTMRSLRSLAVAHQLGHALLSEQDARVSLLGRLLEHAFNTSRFNLCHGLGRDVFDARGRTAQEAVFNVASGTFRCTATQQGWSPYSTWMRGLAWAISGFAEQLEFLGELTPRELSRALTPESTPGLPRARRRPLPVPAVIAACHEAALATSDYYLARCCADGIPMWDTGAPGLARLGDYADRPAEPFNRWEPVDSSAAAITAQGLYRLGNLLLSAGARTQGRRYRQAALTMARTLFAEPYLSVQPKHQGLILHSVYHRPNGWDYLAPGQRVPNGESSMWGDYHARELALLLWREARGESYLTFFDYSRRP
jgi:unsaturated chondroitin disaccharide hydrolase